jgi:hypothetical protein
MNLPTPEPPADLVSSSPIDIDGVMGMSFFAPVNYNDKGAYASEPEFDVERDENGYPILADPNDLYAQSADSLGIMIERKIFQMQNMMRLEPEKYLGDLEDLLSQQPGGRGILTEIFD